MQGLRKALITSAFVVFSTPVFSADLATTDCSLSADAQPVQIRYIHDGDTLHLRDGRKVRLIGINTPELGRDGQADQPLAREAIEAARTLLKNNHQLKLQLGSQPKDHYGRALGHLFLDDGRNLEAELLKLGIGFAISIPPNLALRDCLHQAEQLARKAGLGVWSHPYYQPQPAHQLAANAGGFGRYRGTISRIGHNQRGSFVELSGKIYLPIKAGIATSLDRISSDDLIGRQLEVRGWLVSRKLTKTQTSRGFLPFLINVSHADALSICPEDC